MTDGAGAPLAINRYDEYGVPASGNLGRFQYTGQMWIAEIGLYHFRARAHNPSTGRFMQTDPIGIAGGANLYAYAGNDPVNGRDPSGLAPCDVHVCSTALTDRSDHGSSGGGGGGSRRGDGDFNFPIFVRIGGASSPLDNQDPCNGGFSVNPDAAAGCAIPISQLSSGAVNDVTFDLALLFLPVGKFAQFALGQASRFTASLAARGTSRLGGIVTSTTNSAGGTVVSATGRVVGSDFAGAVNSGMLRGGPVNILSGAHGEVSGVMRAERAFFEADRAAFGHLPGVNVFDVTRMAPGEISSLLRGPGTTIGAFCDSGACLAPFR